MIKIAQQDFCRYCPGFTVSTLAASVNHSTCRQKVYFYYGIPRLSLLSRPRHCPLSLSLHVTSFIDCYLLWLQIHRPLSFPPAAHLALFASYAAIARSLSPRRIVLRFKLLSALATGTSPTLFLPAAHLALFASYADIARSLSPWCIVLRFKLLSALATGTSPALCFSLLRISFCLLATLPLPALSLRGASFFDCYPLWLQVNRPLSFSPRRVSRFLC